MASSSVRIEGLEDLEKKLKKVSDKKLVRGALLLAASEVKDAVADYPEHTEANMPKAHGGWYQRGYGSKYRRRDGIVTSRKTSETLGKKWTIKQRRDKTFVGNNVSYGIWVQDEDHQASFHRARGWKTIQTVAKEEADTVIKIVKKAVDKALKS